MIDHKGKEVSVNEPNSIPEVSRAYGMLDTTRAAPSTGTHTEGNFSKDADNSTSMKEDKSGYYAVPSEHAEDRRHHLRRKSGAEMPKQETSESQAGVKCDSNTRNIPIGSHEDDSGNNHQQIVIPHHASLVTGTTKPMKADVSFWNGNGCQMEASNVSAAVNALTHESQQKRKDNCAGQSQSAAESSGLGLQHTNSNLPSLPLREQWKPISGMDGQNNILMPVKDSDVVLRNDFPGKVILFTLVLLDKKTILCAMFLANLCYYVLQFSSAHFWFRSTKGFCFHGNSSLDGYDLFSQSLFYCELAK